MKTHLAVFLVMLSLACSQAARCQPACATNAAAADYCESATKICNLNGFCGNTSSQYTTTVSSTNTTDENNAPIGDVYCANINNDSWLVFIASATSATFNIWVKNCSKSEGIQMMVVSSTDCYNFTAVSDCWNGDGTGSITASGLTVGSKYYIMIDGRAGDVCDYVIGVSAGVMVVSAGDDQTICRGKSVKLTASGADTYAWSNNLGSGDAKTVSPTATTTYTVTGSNTFGCNDADQVTVTVNALPTVVATASDQSICKGESTTLSASGATSYAWNNGAGTSATSLVYPSSTSTYSVTGTDGNGCTNSASVAVDVQSVDVEIVPVNASPDTVKDGVIDICENNTIVLTSETESSEDVTGVEWSTATSSSGTQTTPLSAAGMYYVTATSGSGCTDVDSVDIHVLVGPPVITMDAFPFFCDGDILSIYTGVENGGQSPRYTWSPVSSTDSVLIVENADSSQHSGYFYVTVTNGCHVASDSVLVVGHSIPYNDIIAPQWVCTSLTYPYLLSTEEKYELEWSTGDTTDSIPLVEHPVSDLAYWLKSYNGYCYYTDSAAIPVYNPTPYLDDEYESCDSAFTLTAGSTVFKTYSWVVNGGVVSSGSAIEISDTGSYVVAVYVTDEHDCPASTSSTVTIHPLPEVEDMLTDLQTIATNAAIIADSFAYSYVIPDDLTGGTKTQYEYINLLEDELYHVTRVDVSMYGCSDTLSQDVHVDVPVGLFVPTAFAPSSTSPGVRGFIPKGFNMDSYTVFIYDTWGNLLWYSDKLYDGHPQEAWDGTYNGTLLAGGSYVWRVKAGFYNGTSTSTFGNVLLVR